MCLHINQHNITDADVNAGFQWPQGSKSHYSLKTEHKQGFLSIDNSSYIKS